jgi:hypothetical protein
MALYGSLERLALLTHGASSDLWLVGDIGVSMQVSEDAGVIVHEIRELRGERERRLQCDLHFIDAEYDRRVRRAQAGVIGGTAWRACSITNPVCLRRHCRWGLRRLRHSLVRQNRR